GGGGGLGGGGRWVGRRRWRFSGRGGRWARRGGGGGGCGRRRRRRRGRGGGRGGRGRWPRRGCGGGRGPRRGELAVHVRSEVVDLRLDVALADGGVAVGRRRRLRPGRAELGHRLTRARGVEREPLAGRLRVALEQAAGLLAGRADLLRAALARGRLPGA